MILLIDNYDSFVHNLARYVGELGGEQTVVRHDALTLRDIAAMHPSHIIISPGPCTPDDAGISMDVIKHFGAAIPVLGICLGHQAIGQVYGGTIARAHYPRHGKASWITHNACDIFTGMENPCRVGRYHSLIVRNDDLPADLEVTARCEAGEIMAIRHRTHPVFGLQFHPESVLTDNGHQYIDNFLSGR